MESFLQTKAVELTSGHNLITALYSTSCTKTGLIKSFCKMPLMCVVGNKNHEYRILNLRNLTDDCGNWCMKNLHKSEFSLSSVYTNIFNVCGFDICEVVQEMNLCIYNSHNVAPESYIFSCYGPGGCSRTHMDNFKAKNFAGNLIIVFNSKFTGGEIELPDHIVSFQKDFLDLEVIAKVVFIPAHCIHKISQVKTGHRFSVVYSMYEESSNLITTIPFTYFLNTSDKEFQKTLADSTSALKNWIKDKKNVYISKWMLKKTSLLKINPSIFTSIKVVKEKTKNKCYKVNKKIERPLFSYLLSLKQTMYLSDFCNFDEPIEIEWNLIPLHLSQISTKNSTIPHFFQFSPVETLNYEYGRFISLKV